MLQGADRRRVLVASIITLVALPFLWASKQSSSSSQDAGVAAIGDAGGIRLSNGASDAAQSQHDISFVASEPGYLGGDSARTNPGTIALTVKGAAAGHHLSGAATFHDLKFKGLVCQTSLATLGTALHVTDTDNGRSVTCTVVQTNATPAGTIIVLGPDAFRALADVVESPIPVELAW